MTDYYDADEGPCGEAFDHDAVYDEDDTGYNWRCLNCGAEGWEEWEDSP
jgi:hypothetical protein